MSYGKPDDAPRTLRTNFFLRIQDFVFNCIDAPVTWWREKVVEPNRKTYYWYHRRYPRVPTVDQCYTDDHACIYEADQQFLRDKKVDMAILRILRKRYENCLWYETNADRDRCKYMLDELEENVVNFFIKYGELGWTQRSIGAYMKQKHKMVWERRFGPVGSGMNRIDQGETTEEKVC
uniref:NADH dehydrogenase [ubiquinone] 1 beta subcomplex subunit 10 n=1 Tax=Liposcelis bostrychophila TaxID=185214 RepID=A0A481SXL3_LIPBO|nr:hypothetical protein [Liposcelis bostrychophila]